MICDIDQILSRASAIRLKTPALARRAGMPVSTIHRFVKRRNGTLATLQKLQEALVAEERALLDHLRQLHGEVA